MRILPFLAAPLLVFPALASAQTADPPIREQEFIALTKSGCRLVLSLPDTGREAYIQRMRRSYATRDFTGPCPFGLVSGMWTQRVGNTTTEYYYGWGRVLTRRLVQRSGAGHKGDAYALGDTTVYRTFADDPWAPKWTGQPGGESWLESPTHGVITVLRRCSKHPERFPECVGSVNHDVHGVRVWRRASSRLASRTDTAQLDDRIEWCPDPGTSNGCEGLWQRLSAPLRADIERFMARAATRDSQFVAQDVKLNVPWVASYTGQASGVLATAAPTAPSPSVSKAAPAPLTSNTTTAQAAPAPPPVLTGPSNFTPTFSDPDIRVTALELPGVPSRGGCLTVSWLTRADYTVVNLYEPNFYTDRWIKDARALVIRNTCREVVWVTAIACHETRMTEGSTATFPRPGWSFRQWRAGDVRAVDYESNSLHANPLYGRDDNTRLGPDSGVAVAYTKRLVRNPQSAESFGWHETIADLLYGAWPAAAMYTSGTLKLTAAGLSDSRRRMAVLDSYSRRIAVHDASAHPSPIGKGAEYPSGFFDAGGRPCSAGNLAGVWRSTQ